MDKLQDREEKKKEWGQTGGGGARASGHGGEHAERGAGDAVHGREREADVDRGRDDEAGDDGALVAQRQAEDDVRGRARAARVRHVLRTARMKASGLGSCVPRQGALEGNSVRGPAHAPGVP